MSDLISDSTNDLISRQAAIDAFDKQIWSDIDIPVCKEIRTAVKKTIEQLPSAQPERKPGRWEMLSERSARCTNCGAIRYTNGRDKTGKGHIFYANFRFCPNCGTPMEVEK